MFSALLSLLVGVFVAQLLWRVAKGVWAWLGRGEMARSAIDRNLVSDDTAAAWNALGDWNALGRDARTLVPQPRRLRREHLRQVMAADRISREEYLEGLRIGWFQVVLLFFIGSVAGLVIEEIWMWVAWGVAQSRPGLVWGPFSPMYGLGVVIMTVTTFRLRRRKVAPWAIFLVAALIGGLLEQVTGWAMETFMNAVSWDYSHLSTALTKWVAWPFLIAWGFVGLAWYWVVMPELLWRIGKPTTRRKQVFVTLLSLYLVADIAMTLACFDRRVERDNGVPPTNAFEEWVDEHYSNEFMSQRFQNMMFNGQAMGITPRFEGIAE